MFLSTAKMAKQLGITPSQLLHIKDFKQGVHKFKTGKDWFWNTDAIENLGCQQVPTAAEIAKETLKLLEERGSVYMMVKPEPAARKEG